MPAATHLLWATGSTVGLSPALADRHASDTAAQEATFVLYAVAAAVGLVLLVLRRGRALPLSCLLYTSLSVPLLAAGVGSAALSGWGGWLLLGSLTALAGEDRAATPLIHVTYAVQVIIGLLVLAAGARFFARRAAAPDPAA